MILDVPITKCDWKKKKKTSRKEITCSGKWHTLKNTGKDDVLFTLNGNKTKHRPQGYTGKDDVLFTLNGNKTKHRPWFFYQG